MKAAGGVPIYRRQDLRGMSVEEQRERNQESLDALADRIEVRPRPSPAAEPS